jgi:hypothetical protein
MASLMRLDIVLSPEVIAVKEQDRPKSPAFRKSGYLRTPVGVRPRVRAALKLGHLTVTRLRGTGSAPEELQITRLKFRLRCKEHR